MCFCACVQRQLHSPQPSRAGAHGGFGANAAAQPPLHRYLSEPPGGAQLAAAAAGLLDGPGGGSLHGGMHSSRGGGGLSAGAGSREQTVPSRICCKVPELGRLQRA